MWYKMNKTFQDVHFMKTINSGSSYHPFVRNVPITSQPIMVYGPYINLLVTEICTKEKDNLVQKNILKDFTVKGFSRSYCKFTAIQYIVSVVFLLQ